MSNVPKQSDDDLRSRLVAALDREYDRLHQEGQRPGWTPWAMSAASAALFWTIINQVENGASLQRAMQPLLATWSVLIGVSFLYAVLDWRSHYPQKTEIVFGAKALIASTPQLFVSLLINGFPIVVVMHSQARLLIEHEIVILSVSVLLSMFTAIVFVASFGDNINGTVKYSKNSSVFKTVMIAGVVLGVSLLVVSAREFASIARAVNEESIAFSDIKLGLLLGGFGVIVVNAIPRNKTQIGLDAIASFRLKIILSKNCSGYELLARAHFGGFEPEELSRGLVTELADIFHLAERRLEDVVDCMVYTGKSDQRRVLICNAEEFLSKSVDFRNFMLEIFDAIEVYHAKLLFYYKHVGGKDEVHVFIRECYDKWGGLIKEFDEIEQEMSFKRDS